MQTPVSEPSSRRSGRGGRQRRSRRLQSVSRLTDDLIGEILRRVPYKSLCRFKCVSRSWLALCSFDGIRQTLSGFFFRRINYHNEFISASGRCPLMEGSLFSFLPAGKRDMKIVDSCNGLLLCRRAMRYPYGYRSTYYFVCNPATGNWIDLPDIKPMFRFGSDSAPVIRLGFDPAVSSHFRVFLVVPLRKEDFLTLEEDRGVQIYSSETRRWSYRQSGWGNDIVVRFNSRTAFFNGTLHLTTRRCESSSFSIVTVDIDGKTWRKIPTPRRFDLIGLSQGCFYAVHMDRIHNDCRLSVWALEDYHGHQWILKHTARLSAQTDFYGVHAIHPEGTLIFLTSHNIVKQYQGGFASYDSTLLSYDFTNNKVYTIKNLAQEVISPHPYVPCFSKWLSDGH